MKKLSGDLTKPHLKQFFKTVPMRDEDGNVITPGPLRHGGPWPKPDKGIRLGPKTQSR